MSLKEQLKSTFEDLNELTQQYIPLSSVSIEGYHNSQTIFKVGSAQINFSENRLHNFQSQFTFDSVSNTITKLPMMPTAIESADAESISPSKQCKVCFRSKEKKIYMEIWDRQRLTKVIEVTSLHKSVYGQALFSLTPARWSSDESKFIYLAEFKEKEKPNYFAEFKDDEEAGKSFEQFDFQQDFGETLGEKKKPALFVYDLKKGTVSKVLNVPDDIIVCYPSYINLEEQGDQTTTIRDQAILLSGVKRDLMKRGFTYCYNREISLYCIADPELEIVYPPPAPSKKEDEKKGGADDKTKEEEEEKKGEQSGEKLQKTESEKKDKEAKKEVSISKKPQLISSDDICVIPVPSQDGTKFSFLFSPKQIVHAFYCGLKVATLSYNATDQRVTMNEKVVLNYKSGKLADPAEFPGLFVLSSNITAYRWLSDNKYLLFQNPIQLSQKIYILNTETKEFKSLDQPVSSTERWTILDIDKHNNIFCNISHVKRGSSLAVLSGLDLTSNMENDISKVVQKINWAYYSNEDPCPESKFSMSNMGEIVEKVIEINGIQTLCFYRKDFKDAEGNTVELENRPILADLHGGPHCEIDGAFYRLNHYILQRGIILIATAYSGTGGYGQHFVEACLKQVGIKEVKEIYDAINYCIDNKIGNASKVGLIGGSNGGFLGSALIATYPSFFKCCIQLSSVHDLTINAVLSDIPEWNHCEALGKDLVRGESVEDILKMIELSPIAMSAGKDIKAKVLVFAGGKDIRTHQSQAVLYYKKLKTMGVDIRMLWFPDEGHSLSNDVGTILEEYMQVAKFLNEELCVAENTKKE